MVVLLNEWTTTGEKLIVGFEYFHLLSRPKFLGWLIFFNAVPSSWKVDIYQMHFVNVVLGCMFMRAIVVALNGPIHRYIPHRFSACECIFYFMSNDGNIYHKCKSLQVIDFTSNCAIYVTSLFRHAMLKELYSIEMGMETTISGDDTLV